MLVYVLFALGFLTGITALAGVLLAYGRRGRARGIVRHHLEWQIRIFWLGVLALSLIAALHALAFGLELVTFGFGSVFVVVPWSVSVVWAGWTLWSIARGAWLLAHARTIE